MRGGVTVVSSDVLDGEACSVTHSHIMLVEGDGVGRCCSYGRGLLLGEVLLGKVPPSSDICPGRDSTRGGCARRGRVQLMRPGTPTRLACDPRGGGGRAWLGGCHLAYTGAP